MCPIGKENGMKKLALNVESLQVKSLFMGAGEDLAGTVHGAAITTAACPPRTAAWTCGIYCPPTTDPAVTGPCAC
jgi:hypothetical protein